VAAGDRRISYGGPEGTSKGRDSDPKGSSLRLVAWKNSGNVTASPTRGYAEAEELAKCSGTSVRIPSPDPGYSLIYQTPSSAQILFINVIVNYIVPGGGLPLISFDEFTGRWVMPWSRRWSDGQHQGD